MRLKLQLQRTFDPGSITFRVYTLGPTQKAKICQMTASPQCSHCLHFNAILCIVQLIQNTIIIFFLVLISLNKSCLISVSSEVDLTVMCNISNVWQVSTNGEISVISGAPSECDCKIDPNCDCFSGGSHTRAQTLLLYMV